jgi:hypothetical protein
MQSLFPPTCSPNLRTTTDPTSFRANRAESTRLGSAPTTDNLSRHVAWPLMVDSSTHQLSDSSPGGPGILFSGASPAPSGLAPWSACDHRRIRHPRRVASHVCVPRCDVRTSLRNLPAPASVSACASKGPIHVIPTTTKTIDEDAAAGGVNAGSAAAALTSLELSGLSRQPAFLRTAMGQRGSSEVGLSTADTVAGSRIAYTRRNPESRKEAGVAHTGRFTTPPVEAAEAHCRHLWVIAWKDGQLTTDEDTLMCGCEAVVFEAMKADATEEVRNAMSQRRGFESPQFDRRLRELRGKVVRFRQRLPQPDPTPAGPAAQRKAA